MTTKTQSQTSSATPTIPQVPSQGAAAQIPASHSFQQIPTRIRDVRDAQVPPLVVESVAEQDKAAICDSLSELGIKLAEIHRTAAEAYLSQGMYEASLPHLQAAATFSPSDIEYQMQLGFVHYVTGDDIAAINAFNNVIGADENNAEAWFNLGMVVFGQAQHAEAEHCFRRSCEIEGQDAQTWNNRGVCLWRLERIDEAKDCFRKALDIDPNDEDAQFNLQNMN